MSPTRRDILKLAAGLGLTGAIPTSAERIAAAEVLNQRISENPALDPAGFADEAQVLIGYHSGDELSNDWLGSIVPEERAGYERAQEAFLELEPHLRTEIGTPITDDPRRAAFWNLADAMFLFAIRSYDAGVRHGAAYENLRRSVIGETKHCLRCQGGGVTRDGATCPACGGVGVVRHSVH